MNIGANARVDYSKIKKEYTKNGKGNVRLTQSTLTLIQNIDFTKTQYTFPVLENDNATGIKPEEIRLNQNDEFIVTSIGMYVLGKRVIGEARTPVGGYFYITHAPTYQVGVATTIQPLYDGFLRIGINNINYLDKFDLRKFENVQRTQWNNTGAVDNVDATLPSTQFDTDNMFEISPNITLSGAKKNEITAILPSSVNAFTLRYVDNLNEAILIDFNAIALEFRGMLAQNGAVFQGSAPRMARPGIRR